MPTRSRRGALTRHWRRWSLGCPPYTEYNCCHEFSNLDPDALSPCGPVDDGPRCVWNGAGDGLRPRRGPDEAAGDRLDGLSRHDGGGRDGPSGRDARRRDSGTAASSSGLGVRAVERGHDHECRPLPGAECRVARRIVGGAWHRARNRRWVRDSYRPSPPGVREGAASIPVVWVLSMHSLGAGLVIGAVYATMPALGAVLGLAIVSHKGPAGYAAARRLRRRGASVLLLLWPAAAVCIAAVPVGLIDPPTSDAFHAVVFGAATGLFLHVAIDFLPRCGWGSELYRAARVRPDSQSDPTARRVGNVRHHAVWSTFVGGLIVAGAWALL